MECQTLTNCISEVRAYISGDMTGFPLLINVQNHADFSYMRERFELDTTIEKLYVSEMMQEHGLPDLSGIYAKAFEKGTFAVIGVSQSLMLKGEDAFMGELRQLANTSARGRTIILLSHSESFLRDLVSDDGRLSRRILFCKGTTSTLPIIIVSSKKELDKGRHLYEVKGLVHALERFTGIPADKEFVVETKFSAAVFAHSLYPLRQSATIYERLKQKYPILGDSSLTEKSGLDKDWVWLSEELQKSGTMENVVERCFGDIWGLSWQLPKEIKGTDERRRWLYWLSLSIYPPKSDYFRLALSRSKSLSDLEEELYMALLYIKRENEEFTTLYSERAEILEKISTNQKLLIKYCQNAGKWDKDTIFYLTDRTEIERSALLKCLSSYEYTANELNKILKYVSPELEIYLREYDITSNNADIENNVLSSVSVYFTEYKRQKVTNRIKPEFLSCVEQFAETRPYNKFLTRISLLNKLEVKEAEVFFFDALGVEYLSYIVAKCEDIGLLADIKIGRGELPSITEKNKDFYKFFSSGQIHKIDELDECKHHSKKFDYQKCREPLHIFDELRIIDREIKNIYAKMASEHIEKAVIVSDHGASRLAVIMESENDAIILPDKGKHSGRCAPAEKDPKIPFATYENGYAVLANYDRFKGGRKADVEVHGGATLEEILIPIIVLSLRPETIEYSFVESQILFKPGQDAHLILFCNIPMKKPQLKINGKSYDGAFTIDKQHAEFYMEGVRRKGKYSADVYDGGVSQGVSLEFEIKKQTQEDDLGI